jgi:hypothetical protein
MADTLAPRVIPAHRMSPADAIRIARETATELLATYPDLAADAEAFLGTLDGECNALDVAARLIERSLERDDLGEQISFLLAQRAEAAKQLRERRERFFRQRDRLRESAKEIIAACQTPGAPNVSLRRAVFTAWVNQPNDAQRKLIEVDAKQTPADLMKPQPDVPDRDAIRARLQAGEQVPGWSLDNAPTTLTVSQR